MTSEPITANRFFNCTQCGQCCLGFGGTYVSDQDLSAIGLHLGLSSADVQKTFCVPSGRRYVLAQRSDGYCIFWDRICTIHSAKPRMCRQWPFISGLKADPGNWQVMAGMCPGICSDVDLRQLLSYLDNLDHLGLSARSTVTGGMLE